MLFTGFIPLLILVPGYREIYQLIYHIWKRLACTRPHFWKARGVRETRHRVDLVDQQGAVVAAQKKIDPGEPRAVDSLKGGDGHLTDPGGKLVGNRRRYDKLVIA